jgi:hypothetical protein
MYEDRKRESACLSDSGRDRERERENRSTGISKQLYRGMGRAGATNVYRTAGGDLAWKCHLHSTDLIKQLERRIEEEEEKSSQTRLT